MSPAAPWPKVAHRIRSVRAANQCECRGTCGDRRCQGGRCPEKHSVRSFVGGRKQQVAFLDVLALDGNQDNRDPDNLSARCQWCRP